jgi:hypothetical protein
MHYNTSVKCLTNIKGKERFILRFTVFCRKNWYVSIRKQIVIFTVWNCTEKPKEHYSLEKSLDLLSFKSGQRRLYSIFVIWDFTPFEAFFVLFELSEVAKSEPHCREFFISLLQGDKPLKSSVRKDPQAYCLQICLKN